MGPIQSLTDLISMIRRRLPIIMTLMVAGMLWALYMAVTSPLSYEARAVIQIDAPVITDPVSRSSPQASLRVQLIEQRLMSRENLRRLIERYELFSDARAMPESMKLNALREGLRIESVAASSSLEGASNVASIIITASAGSPQIAADIANDMAEDVVSSDSRNRDARINEAREFLVAERARLETMLQEQDKIVADFATEHEDSLPDARVFQQSEMESLAVRETALQQAVMTLRRDRLALEQSQAESGSDSVVQQLRTTELSLAQARRSLPAGHPEILRLEKTLQDLTSGSAVAGSAGSQFALIDSQLQTMADEMTSIRARLAEIEIAQNRAPQISQQYGQLDRERQNVRDQFNEISRRLAEIEALQVLNANNQTENMFILEPAVPPEFPAASDRKKSAILGGFGAITVTALIAIALELMHPVLRNVRQFESVTGIRPVMALPYRPDGDEIFLTAIKRGYVVGICVVGLIVALWLIDMLPPPLSSLAPPSIKISGE